MNEFKRMIIKVSDVANDVATIPTTNDHTDGSWLSTDIYVGELFLNIADDILQTRTDAGIVTLYDGAGSSVSWGDILGTLSDQTDLQDALDLKVNNSDYTPSHSLLVQQSGTGSPTSLSVGNNTLVGRQSGGGSQIDDLSVSDVKTMLSIDNVDNTSDLNKPVSTAQQTEIDTKQDTLISGQNIKTVNGGTILGSGDISLDNNFISLNDAPESYTGSGGYAVQVNAGETGLEFVASGGGGGGNQVMTFNFEGNHSSNSSTTYYSFRSKADGSLYNVGNTSSLSTYGNYRTSLIIPKDCFVKSIYMVNVNSNSRNATETNLRLYKNGTEEYTGERILWTTVNPTYYGEWQTTGLTSSDNSFLEGDIIDIAFNSDGTWGGTVCMITLETI